MVSTFVDPKSKSDCMSLSNGRNPGVRSVEEEIEKALHKLGMIADYNFGDLKKIGWNRATRTDKRVHAL